jgi:hypothetical protein
MHAPRTSLYAPFPPSCKWGTPNRIIPMAVGPPSLQVDDGIGHRHGTRGTRPHHLETLRYPRATAFLLILLPFPLKMSWGTSMESLMGMVGFHAGDQSMIVESPMTWTRMLQGLANEGEM